LLGGVVDGRIDDTQPYHLEYAVRCDDAWRTISADVSGTIGRDAVRVIIMHDMRAGRWTRDGHEQPQVAGAVDVDLGFTPATNTLPIRRLTLPVGGAAPVRAAWLRFPELELVPLDQVYTHEAEERYVYESDGGRFRATLEVDAAGLVLRYGDYWIAEPVATG
jgi:hypothetical protein